MNDPLKTAQQRSHYALLFSPARPSTSTRFGRITHSGREEPIVDGAAAATLHCIAFLDGAAHGVLVLFMLATQMLHKSQLQVKLQPKSCHALSKFCRCEESLTIFYAEIYPAYRQPCQSSNALCLVSLCLTR